MGTEKNDEIKLTTDHPELLKKESSTSDEVLRSVAYTGVQLPYDGVSQLVNKLSDSRILPETSFASKPDATEFGSAKWTAQMTGSAIGAIPWLLGIGKGVQTAGNPFLRRLEGESIQFAGIKTSTTALSTAESALTGAIYEGTFKPVSDQNNFWAERAKNAGIGAMTLGSFTYGFNKLSPSQFPLEASMSDKFVAMMTRARIAGTAGLGAGFINSESTALLKENRLATGSEIGKAMLSYGLMSSAIAMAGKPEVLANPKQIASSKEFVKPIESFKYADPVLQTPGFARLIAESRDLIRTGSSAEAITKLDAAGKLLEAKPAQAATADGLMELGSEYMRLGGEHLPNARGAYEQAVSIYQAKNSPVAAEAAIKLSVLEEGAGNTLKAAYWLDTSLKIKTELAASNKLTSAEAVEFRDSQSKQYDKLEDLYRRSGQNELADKVKATRPMPEPARDYRRIGSQGN